MRGVVIPITHEEMDTEKESDLLRVTQGLRGGAGMSHSSLVRSKGPAPNRCAVVPQMGSQSSGEPSYTPSWSSTAMERGR